MRHRLPLLCAVAVMLGTLSVSTSTLIPLTFSQIVSGADAAFLGETVARRSEWNLGPHGRSIVTFVTFKVERVLKGQVAQRVELRFRGGQIGHEIMRIGGMPQFAVGDRDVLFISPLHNAVSPLVGFSYGRFRVIHDGVSGTDEVRGPDGSPLLGTSRVGKATLPLAVGALIRPISYPEFERMVQDAIARGAR